MNRNDFDEAIKNVDKDIVSEAKNKKSGKKLWISIAASAACILLAVVVLSVGLGINNVNKLSGNGKAGDINKISGSGDAQIKYNDGILGERKDSDRRDYGEAYRDFDPVPMPELGEGYEAADSSFEMPSEYIKTSEEVPWDFYEVEARAGTLTAGEWRDTDNLADWYKLVRDNNWYDYAEERNIFSNKAVTVKVTDEGAACFNVKVELKDGNKVIAKGQTNIKGEAYLFYNVDGGKANPSAVTVNGKDYSLSTDYIEIEAKNCGIELKAIDLMYMVDTTGSMGDELNYIKAELVDMVNRIAEKGQAVSIRVSVNFYRDEGDDYIVKYFDFREDINACYELIKNEKADGGGDTPEAVHTALDNAVNGHTWREDALKLCFLVLDAPPHSEEEIQGINADLRETFIKAAEAGIRFIPVMCSGADKATEYLLRSLAAITNGTFIFLTDDSGIGNPHIETSVGDYNVEKLNDCMVRVVCEFAGFEYTAPAQQNQQSQNGN